MNRLAPIRIVGTGPVSLLLRGLLARQGFEPGELACDPIPAELPPWLAQRVIALSLGSWQLLARVAPAPPCAPIFDVEVTLRGAFGRARLSAQELRTPALGHVVRYEALHRALREALAVDAATGSGRPTGESGRSSGESGAPQPATGSSSFPETGKTPDSSITVIADGNPGEGSRTRDFDQAALLATVQASLPREGVAFERFTRDGPLALLPLPESGLYSLVWCAPTRISQARLGLPAGELAASLQREFGPALGELAIRGEPQLAPLRRSLRRQVVIGSEVAIGNAAQALHPVAGQGLNLGFRDAFVLAELLGEARAQGRPPAAVLPRFVRARRIDRTATVAITDTLATAFTIPVLHPAESIALGALGLAGPARRALARTFMFGLRG